MSHVLLWQPSEFAYLIVMILFYYFQKINMMMMMARGSRPMDLLASCSHECVCVISDHLKHDTLTVHTFQQKVMSTVKADCAPLT